MEGALSVERFVAAQEPVWPAPLLELGQGRKRGHWMWFVFPQLIGLGHSEMARHYAIRSEAEARTYLAHPLLASRLGEASRTLLRHRGRAPSEILGAVDALKLCSSMTLFSMQPRTDPVFSEVLAAFFCGTPCAVTRAALGR